MKNKREATIKPTIPNIINDKLHAKKDVYRLWVTLLILSIITKTKEIIRVRNTSKYIQLLKLRSSSEKMPIHLYIKKP